MKNLFGILAVFITVSMLAACSLSGWLTYTNTTYQFQFQYPSGSTLSTDTPTAARIQLPITPGTNLVEKFLDVSVEEGAMPCLSPNSLWFNSGIPPIEPDTTDQVINGIYWTVESGSDAAAGSRYEWIAYSTSYPEGACVSLTFVLHSHSPELIDPPPPEFDESGESLVFSLIVATFQWLIPSPTPVDTWTPTPVDTWTPTPAPYFYFVPKFNAYCRSGPDMIFGSITFAMKDQSYPIDGRNQENTWLYIMISPEVGCWVPVEYGTSSGDTEQVRVLHKIPTPTFTPLPVNCAQYHDSRSCDANPACTWNFNLKSCTNK